LVITALYRFIIIITKLDIKSGFFRFNNPLYYTFLGADLAQEKQFDIVVVDALVETGGKNVLYSGILSEWRYDNEGKLDTLTLVGCFRRFVNDSTSSTSGSPDPLLSIQSKRLEIPGSGTVLKSSKIVNFNFQYLTHSAWNEKITGTGLPQL
jgi:hypothetical protein